MSNAANPEKTKEIAILGSPLMAVSGQDLDVALSEARLLTDHVQELLWQGMRQADGKDVSFGYDIVVTMDFLLDIATCLYRAAGAEA
ncbi:hypothetical protein I5U57_06845 [Stenotrophomonas maltophilia]|uniref:Uncharacterized protein n=1 Tax=Stenotrophomonas maltophilia TaxID=40324 RepID=A0AA40XVT0_STEMA|nr:hypothetical protein [Stenotrophomonas geniculata]MBH1639165.1 hypothetical protein [Stenotrophomonas maltophilia]MCI1065157.1 hypothetical protein [Stenotrophomonas maltophilia]MCI1106277.1 hypothetical protein [Stenotrophomonas maltophilia]